MSKLAVLFFIGAVIAGIFGFVGVIAAATEVAKILFYLFVVLFLFTIVAMIINGRRIGRWIYNYLKQFYRLGIIT